MKKTLMSIPVLLFLVTILFFISSNRIELFGTVTNKTTSDKAVDTQTENQGGLTAELNPLTIAALRAGNYSGSELVIEDILMPGSTYNRYLTSYRSEGLKIYALLTIPQGTPPENGWPVIIFNHGYIPPREYQTTERYIAYMDGFSRNGYILFRPDYRGHGNSEGQAAGGYGSNAYTVDVLNAVASVKRLNNQKMQGICHSERSEESFEDPSPRQVGTQDDTCRLVNVDKMGMWGHSMGGFITLRSMVTRKDIKAGVIWAGVVGSYPDLINNWRRHNSPSSLTPTMSSGVRRWRQVLVDQFGEPSNDSPFWQSISANFFLNEISGPVQLHHGTADSSVPLIFSQDLEKQMKDAGKEVELYVYDGDDHNISANFNIAMQKSVEFFDKQLK